MNETHNFKAHSSYVLDVAFTNDSKILVSSDTDNLIKLWSAPDWQLLSTFEGHQNSVNSFSLSADGTVLATGSSDNTVKLWDFPTGTERITLQDTQESGVGGANLTGRQVGRRRLVRRAGGNMDTRWRRSNHNRGRQEKLIRTCFLA